MDITKVFNLQELKPKDLDLKFFFLVCVLGMYGHLTQV